MTVILPMPVCLRSIRAPRRLLATACAAVLTACSSPTLPPAPDMPLPAQFHHQAGWLATTLLADAAIAPAGAAAPWWAGYGDATLDALMAAIDQDNPTLAQAQARWREAQAAVGAVRAGSAPQLGANAAATRAGTSASNSDSPTNQLLADLTLNWALDIWGRNTLQVEAAQSSADALAMEVDAARLALQLAIAQAYVQLRTLELQRQLLTQTLHAYQRSQQLTHNQYEAGFVARSDVIQAETQLQSIRTQITANERQHALTRNAIAALAGRTPGQLALPPAAWAQLPTPPAPPPQLPSALLLQRPDLAAAQHQLAAANARLGVAHTAWLPELDLSASAALQAGSLSRFIDAPLRVWSLGPALAATLFDGGARQAATAQARAAYDAQADNWRALVLQAIQETEDALASSQWLREQDVQQQLLVRLAADNLRVVENQYQAGMVSYLEVATAQNLALASQRNALEVQSQRLLASMELVTALGGGWSTAEASAEYP